MRLGDFLKRELSNGRPWNCSTLPADRCLSLGYPDFAAPWRHLTAEADIAPVVIAAGGLAALWERAIGRALDPVGECGGVPLRIAELQAGDIAVVAALGFEVGAIWTGQRWAMRAPRGLHFLAEGPHIAIRKAWRP